MSRAVVVAALLAQGSALAEVTISIIDTDVEGVGFKDRTPVDPVGGNPGTTLGEQRLNVFREAARRWRGTLDSDIEVNVNASFAPLRCDGDGAVLGSAGPRQWVTSDSLPEKNVWFVKAMANRLLGRRTVSDTVDIEIQFSSALDEPECLGGQGWYYGYDAQSGPKSDLLVVVLHELGHGLGFASIIDTTTFRFRDDIPDVWSRFLLDGVSGSTWRELGSVNRAASAVSGRLAWSGPTVNAQAELILRPALVLRVTGAPGAPEVVGTYPADEASFSAPIGSQLVTGPLVGAPGNRLGCEPLPALGGATLLVERGECLFVDKANHALDAGAGAVIVTNNRDGRLFMGLPAGVTLAGFPLAMVGISRQDGARLWAAVDAGVAVTAGPVRDADAGLAGSDEQRRVLMYAPDPFAPGSSLSHFSTSAAPNLLMEPFAAPDLDGGLDLTVALFRDIGWFRTDLSVAVTGPGVVTASQAATFTIEVTNTAPSPAPGVTLAAESPLAFVSNAGACTTAFPCALGDFGPREKKTITSTWTAGAAGVDAGVKVTVSSAENYNAANDVAEVRVAAPPAGGCSCGAGEAGLSLVGLVLVGLRRRRAST